MCRLLLSDLDGTLLKTDKTISLRTVSELERCRKKGFFIGISTARSEGNAEKFISLIKPDLIISSCGALVRFRGGIIYKAEFSAKETRAIIDTALYIGGEKREITVDTEDAHYWNYRLSPKELDKSWGDTVYTDYSDFNEASLKICVELPDPKYAEIIARSAQDCEYIKFSDGNWYKFSRRAASKENALSAVSDTTGIPLSDIIYFGDDYSDIGTLKICGRGIAMGNAVTEAKNAADETTVSNDCDGVACWLEKNI